jgi:deoxycytidylate deaminase
MKSRFFELAKRAARKSTSKFKLGCVIVRKNRVINFGFNDMTKTHPKSNSSFNTLHAEVNTIIGLSYEETKGCDIYVFRELKNGDLAMAKPCETCLLAIKKAGIANIYYTTENGFTCQQVH